MPTIFIVIIVIKSIPKVMSTNMAFSKMTYCGSVLGDAVQLAFCCQPRKYCFCGGTLGNDTTLQWLNVPTGSKPLRDNDRQKQVAHTL